MARSLKGESSEKTGLDAAWYATPEGRHETEREFTKALREGSLVRSAGMAVPLSDPAILAELVAKAKARATKAISIRVSVADLERAREIADREGVGYQTVLKRAINEGLKKSSLKKVS